MGPARGEMTLYGCLRLVYSLVIMIRRPKSKPIEPETSPEMRSELLELIRKKVAEVHGLEEYDPVVAMALIATDESIQATVMPGPNGNPLIGVQTVLKAHSEVARYVHPTVKQVELTGPAGGPVQVRSGLATEIADLLKLVGTNKEVSK